MSKQPLAFEASSEVSALSSVPQTEVSATRKRRSAWLSNLGSHGGRSQALACAFMIGDALGAIGFAAGLCWALRVLPRGIAAASPGAGLALGFATLRAVMGALALESGAQAAQQIKDHLREGLFYAALDDGAGRQTSTGQSMAVVVEGVEALDGYYTRFVPAACAARVAPLLVVAAMACVNPIAGGLVLASFVPFAVAMAFAGVAAGDEGRQQFEALGRLSHLFADRIRALPVLLAYQAEPETATDLANASRELAARTLRVLRIAFVSSAVLDLFAAIAVALVAIYCGLTLLGLLTASKFAPLDLTRALFVLILAPEAYLPFRRLAAAYHDRQAAEAAVDALTELQRQARPVASLPRVEGSAPEVRFQDVTVRYPESQVAALQAFNLTIRPGETVAIRGPSGAGKSTALNLLLGLAEPTSGAVMVDGIDGPALHKLAWAGQAPMVMPGDLAANVVVGRPDADGWDVARAASLAGLDMIPGGLERRIDERGGGLSGGERRRLALARAILRDAPLLILDEPTANLDAQSESDLIPIIRAMAQGRTTLIATHSDVVAAIADRVVTLPV